MAKSSHEAHVRGVPPAEYGDVEYDEHGLAVLRVDEGDKADPEPAHAGPAKLGLKDVPFDPNAALRAKMGLGVGLQDSEARNPAVWVDSDSAEARNAAAAAHVAEAERNLAAAKKRAAAIKKGEPFDGVV